MKRGNDTPGPAATMSAMTTSLRTVVLVALLGVAATANGQPLESPRREPNLGIYAAELGGGIVGGAACGAGLGLLTFYVATKTRASIEEAATAVACALYAGGAAGCAGGTYLMGSSFGQDGKLLPTAAWAGGTTAVGMALIIAGSRVYAHDPSSYPAARIGSAVSLTGAAVVYVAAPVMATVGYNLSRPRDSLGSRLVPGSVGLASVRDAEGIAHPSLNVRLLSVRF